MTHLRRYLEEHGVLYPEQLAEAIRRQQIYGGSLDTVLLELDLVDPVTLGEMLERACGFPVVPPDLLENGLERPWTEIPDDMQRSRWVEPLAREGDEVVVAVHPDLPNDLLGRLLRSLRRMRPMVTPECCLEKVAAERSRSVVPQRYAVLCASYLSAVRRRPSVSGVFDVTDDEPPTSPRPAPAASQGEAPARTVTAPAVPAVPPVRFPPGQTHGPAKGAARSHASEAGASEAPPVDRRSVAGSIDVDEPAPMSLPGSEPRTSHTAVATAPPVASRGAQENEKGTSGPAEPEPVVPRVAGKSGASVAPSPVPPPVRDEADVLRRLEQAKAVLEGARTRDEALEAIAAAAMVLSPRVGLFRARGNELVGLTTPQSALEDLGGKLVAATEDSAAGIATSRGAYSGLALDADLRLATGASATTPCLLQRVDVRGRAVVYVYLDRHGEPIGTQDVGWLGDLAALGGRVFEEILKQRRQPTSPNLAAADVAPRLARSPDAGWGSAPPPVQAAYGDGSGDAPVEPLPVEPPPSRASTPALEHPDGSVPPPSLVPPPIPEPEPASWRLTPELAARALERRETPEPDAGTAAEPQTREPATTDVTAAEPPEVPEQPKQPEPPEVPEPPEQPEVPEPPEQPEPPEHEVPEPEPQPIAPDVPGPEVPEPSPQPAAPDMPSEPSIPAPQPEIPPPPSQPEIPDFVTPGDAVGLSAREGSTPATAERRGAEPSPGHPTEPMALADTQELSTAAADLAVPERPRLELTAPPTVPHATPELGALERDDDGEPWPEDSDAVTVVGLPHGDVTEIGLPLDPPVEDTVVGLPPPPPSASDLEPSQRPTVELPALADDEIPRALTRDTQELVSGAARDDRPRLSKLTMHSSPPPPPLPPPPTSAFDEGEAGTSGSRRPRSATIHGLPPPELTTRAGATKRMGPRRDELVLGAEEEEVTIIPLAAPIAAATARGRIELEDEDWVTPGSQLASDSQQGLIDAVIDAVVAGDADVDALREHGDTALLRLVAQFPGPLEVLRRDLRALPPPSAHGPLVRTVISVGAPVVPHLVDLFEHPNPDVRFYAAFVFHELRDPRCMRPLATLAFDANGDVRVVSMRVLETYRRSEGFEAAAAIVREQLVGDGRAQQLHAARASGTLRDIGAIPQLVELLTSSDRFIQEAALESLCSITGQQHGLKPHRWRAWYEEQGRRHRIEWIIDSLRHRDLPVRRWAADELVRITGHRVPFSPMGDKRAREVAAKAWTDWWEAKGREMFGG